MTTLHGGIEGGGTSSKLVLINSLGEVVCRVIGAATNHFVVGMAVAATEIVRMVEEAKKAAKVPPGKPLDSLGLSISGFAAPELHPQLINLIREIGGCAVSVNFHVSSDTHGPLFTATKHGGLVLIAGTGTVARVLHVSGITAQFYFVESVQKGDS
jgi:N-acetylglucosamine kinase